MIFQWRVRDTVSIDDCAENVRAAERMGMAGHHFTSLGSLRERIESAFSRGPVKIVKNRTTMVDLGINV
ncbi:hypothetical protein SAMN05421505_101145 [Sinosporangium album]|uniref:Uncharacterized protein n=1 Tax=Sinosporangium album TaxID=504805 RepID=A0A1G7QYA5_9ACTN|nr:hypothetical protein SAMN05421505_101145 [Sinosporangium album]